MKLSLRDSSHFGVNSPYFYIGLGLVLAILAFLYILYRRRNVEIGVPEGGDRVDQVLAEAGQSQMERAATVGAHEAPHQRFTLFRRKVVPVKDGPFHNA